MKLNQLKSESESKVDDDLAKRYYNDDTATLDQLKEEVCADLQAEADSQFFNAAGSELLNEVIDVYKRQVGGSAETYDPRRWTGDCRE